MTDHCYIAVKGSLHSTDSSVFGLTTEEIIALSKRFSDSCKQVINGVLFKGNPINVINALGEIGYRVICSSGETEIVWTLRREVLVSQKADNDETCKEAIARNIAALGQYDYPQKTVSEAVRKSSISPLRRGTDENIRTQSVVPTEKPERKKPDRLGSKPEDKAEYGPKGSTIDIKDIESIEESPPPAEKKIILNTNKSSECNPLSFRNLEPLKPKDFVSTYSETIAKSAGITANTLMKNTDVNCETVCQPANPRNYSIKECTKPEFVLAEFTAESTMANTGRRPSPSAGKNLNVCPTNIPPTHNACPQNIERIPPTHNACPQNIGRIPPTHNACPQNIGRNQNMPQSTMNSKKRCSTPSPTVQKRKTLERIGTKPEDLAQYGVNKNKIEVIDMINFEEMPEENVAEKRIILNTNDSSEANPLSHRNLEPQEDLMKKFAHPSKRRDV